MKMWALIRQEIRSSSLKAFLAFLFIFMMGTEQMGQLIFSGPLEYPQYSNTLTFNAPLHVLCGFLQVACIALGVSVAWTQFGRPSMRKEWGFLLHRPICRWQITLSKMLGAAVPLLLFPMAVWFWHWRLMMQLPVWEFTTHQLFEGWLFPGWGYAVYLAAALTIMNKDTWIVRRCLPLLLLLIAWQYLYNSDGWSVREGMIVCGGFMVILVQQLFACMQRRTF